MQRIASVLGGRRTEERLAEVERAIRKLGDAERDRATALDARVSEIAQATREQPTAKDLREFKETLRSVAGPQQVHRRLFDDIDRIAASGRPLLVGPWTGEVGFELLYWIPFVEWVRAHWSIAPAREVVVSRGGVASWYGRDAAGYADVFSFLDPEAFCLAVSEEKRKHRRPGALEERVTEAVVRQRACGDIDVLHPGLMYRAFAPYWSDDAGYSLVSQFTRPRRLEPPTEGLPLGLPPDYVAVRFYFSECFPETAENRAFAHGVVASLAERSTVVVLNPGFRADEHADWAPELAGRIVGITEGISPERNLTVQSAVIARARSFVGTYGGYSYLAPLYGVPAVAFYSRPSFKLHHLHVAQRAFADIGAAALLPIDVAQANLVRTALDACVTA